MMYPVLAVAFNDPKYIRTLTLGLELTQVTRAAMVASSPEAYTHPSNPSINNPNLLAILATRQVKAFEIYISGALENYVGLPMSAASTESTAGLLNTELISDPDVLHLLMYGLTSVWVHPTATQPAMVGLPPSNYAARILDGRMYVLILLVDSTDINTWRVQGYVKNSVGTRLYMPIDSCGMLEEGTVRMGNTYQIIHTNNFLPILNDTPAIGYHFVRGEFGTGYFLGTSVPLAIETSVSLDMLRGFMLNTHPEPAMDAPVNVQLDDEVIEEQTTINENAMREVAVRMTAQQNNPVATHVELDIDRALLNARVAMYAARTVTEGENNGGNA